MSKDAARMMFEQAKEIFYCIAPFFSQSGVRVMTVGSFRRHAETVGDLDFVALAWNEEQIQKIQNIMAVLDYETNFKGPRHNKKLLKQQAFTGGKRFTTPHTVEFHYCGEESLGANMIMWTGNTEFHIMCRNRATELGMVFKEHGLFGRHGETRIAVDEDHILELLGLSEYKDPTKRSIQPCSAIKDDLLV